jgi:hypothetical protein
VRIFLAFDPAGNAAVQNCTIQDIGAAQFLVTPVLFGETFNLH